MESKFYSQVGQDQWVVEFFNYKKNGYFIDIGAYDGIDFSNTYYLEKNLNWDGICIEADQKNYESLVRNRNCICVNKAAYHQNTVINFLSDGNMGGSISDSSKFNQIIEAIRLEDLLEYHKSPRIIDYISLDIEGKEYEALLGFPFKYFEVILWTIEHNLHHGAAGIILKSNIKNIMQNNGYFLFRENVGTSPLYPMEDWYINKKYIKY